MKRFRGGLIFKAQRLVYHSTLGSRAIKKKKGLGCEGYRAGRDRLEVLEDQLPHLRLLRLRPVTELPYSLRDTNSPTLARKGPVLPPWQPIIKVPFSLRGAWSHLGSQREMGPPSVSASSDTGVPRS